jgi:hypothetical protein
VTTTAAANLDESMKDLKSPDKDRQDRGFQTLMEMTAERVDWAYDVWDDLLRLTARGDNRQRSIAGQLLSNLPKSDPEERVAGDAERLIAVTRDERFVTARHVLLALWKVAEVGERQRKAIVDGLVRRYKECKAEKNGTLIRYDLQRMFKRIYEQTGDEALRWTAEQLIGLEEDPKYKKKYSTVWRSAAHMRGCAERVNPNRFFPHASWTDALWPMRISSL